MLQMTGIVIVVVVLVIAALACNALALQGLWNYVIAAVLDLPHLSFKLALGVAIILWLFGGGSSATVRRQG